MRKQRFEYGRLVEAALRTVVRDVLARVAKEGIDNPHHFFITFRTSHPGVVMPQFLRERYPTDMTIVLQHQYWDLEVDETAFSVTLSFNDQLQRMRIPFEAIKVFADPGVEFGLQFTLEDAEEDAEVTPLRADAPALPGPNGTEEAPNGREGGAEIVTLDRFRKK